MIVGRRSGQRDEGNNYQAGERCRKAKYEPSGAVKGCDNYEIRNVPWNQRDQVERPRGIRVTRIYQD
jgi:hypothetical protein